jgi:hypothetical protein
VEKAVIRNVADTDMAFIYRSILMGTYHGNRPGKGGKIDPRSPVDFFSAIPQDTFMGAYHGFLDHLFSRPGIVIRVACLESDPDVILGFSVAQNNVLHFVFVKPQWRKIGIAKMLVPEGIDTVSGFTRVGDVIRRKKNWSFNPWQ